MRWVVAVVLLVALLVGVAWRQRGRNSDRFLTQRDLARQNSKVHIMASPGKVDPEGQPA